MSTVASLPSIDFFTPKEAADRVRLNSQVFRRLLNTGGGPAVHKIGGKRLIRADDFVVWIDKHRVRSDEDGQR